MSFNRDEFIGFRCPRDIKARLDELARKKLRDKSSLAIEFVVAGLDRLERETASPAPMATALA